MLVFVCVAFTISAQVILQALTSPVTTLTLVSSYMSVIHCIIFNMVHFGLYLVHKILLVVDKFVTIFVSCILTHSLV